MNGNIYVASFAENMNTICIIPDFLNSVNVYLSSESQS